MSGRTGRLSKATNATLRGAAVVPWFAGMSLRRVFTATSNVTITASGTAHTKGSWTQLVASTASESAGLVYFAGSANANNTNTSILLDIGVGASGSESVVVPNIPLGGAAGVRNFIPIRIPSGSRVSARCQSVVTSKTVSFVVHLFAADFADRIPTVLDSIGTNTATSGSTAMSGASGTWVEITSATTKDYQALVLCPAAETTTATTNVQYSIGVGAAGSEVEIGHASYGAATNPSVLDTNFASAMNLSASGLFIPTGTRIAVQHNIAATPGKSSVGIIGVPYV